MRLYLPAYEELVAPRAWLLEGVTLGTLDEAVAALPRTGEGLAAAVLGAATVLALRREAWAIEALPGQPVLCTRGEHFLPRTGSSTRCAAGRTPATGTARPGHSASPASR